MRNNSTFSRRVLPLVVCILLSVQQLMASTKNDMTNVATDFLQERFALSGKITDPSGEPIVGAIVIVTETQSGTYTDVEGNYSLNVSQGQELRFSMIGYTSQTYTVTTASVHNVVLEEDALTVNEVVVTALGLKRDVKAVGYAVTEVSGDALTETRQTNVTNALSGVVPGLQIAKGSGATGSSKITIRG
ncbi:MAG: carboxypeptidase-like regulatory domain-containing protein, partial [Rikenellaceae bacterium]